MPLNNQNGTSLVEILLSVVLMAAILIPLALAFPSLKKSLFKDRQNLTAVQLANSEIAQIRSRPYNYLDTTEDSYFGSDPCDCTAPNVFQVLPSTPVVSYGVEYRVKSCVHFVNRVGSTWTPQCAASGDTGYKNVLVRVEWTQAGKDVFVTQETMSTRYN